MLFEDELMRFENEIEDVESVIASDDELDEQTMNAMFERLAQLRSLLQGSISYESSKTFRRDLYDPKVSAGDPLPRLRLLPRPEA
jgi:hypothetical protein